MEIEKICVLGSGTMGHGIAVHCAQNGFQVNLYDITEDLVQNGLSRIKKYLHDRQEKKKMTEDEVTNALSRIRTSLDLTEAAKDTDLVIEAVVEDLKIKQDIFRQLDQICPAHTIFASNASYLPITEIAAATKRLDRFVGMHWFNPPQIMRGMEIVKIEGVSPETLDIVINLSKKLGKEPALCEDSVGFIANHILQIWRNEAGHLCDEGVASFRDIDTIFKSSYGFKMGPFEFKDLVGMDICLKNPKGRVPRAMHVGECKPIQAKLEL